MSFLERCPQFRDVLIEGFHCITKNTHTMYGATINNFSPTGDVIYSVPHTHTHTYTHTHTHTDVSIPEGQVSSGVGSPVGCPSPAPACPAATCEPPALRRDHLHRMLTAYNTKLSLSYLP